MQHVSQNMTNKFCINEIESWELLPHLLNDHVSFQIYYFIVKYWHMHAIWCIIPLLIEKLVMKNSVSSLLSITFIVVSNCVWIKTTKFSKILTTTNFYFKGKIHVYLEYSTMVNKYLWPWINDIEYGSHTSTWIKWRYFLDLYALRGKGSLLLCKMTNITNKIFFIFNKKKYVW